MQELCGFSDTELGIMCHYEWKSSGGAANIRRGTTSINMRLQQTPFDTIQQGAREQLWTEVIEGLQLLAPFWEAGVRHVRHA
jgi:hypothetical protein